MKNIRLGNSFIQASEIALGCMRMSRVPYETATRMVRSSLERGINYFDHADRYAKGESERVFGQIMQKESIERDKIFIQSKCGIRDGYFDFTKEHILSSVDGSLQRLGTDYLDVLLLHRPDALVEPEEVAEAFAILYASGKSGISG
jgi:predicted oxidoreductase